MRLEGVFPKPALVYEPNDNWQFRLLGEILFDSFRTDDVVTPDPRLQLHNAIVQYSEYRFGIQAKYSPCKQIRPAPYIKIGLEGKF